MPKGIRKNPPTVACPGCDGEFVQHNHAKRFCSHACLFWSKVEKGGPEECWLWRGGRDADGYGEFHSHRAHRFAWETVNGPMEPTLLACHTCDNPPCVNPAHIWPGTHQQNILDAIQKQRRVGEKAGGLHKLREFDVLEIRKRITAGDLFGEIAAHYNVNKHSIVRIADGSSWAHLGGAVTLSEAGTARRRTKTVDRQRAGMNKPTAIRKQPGRKRGARA